MGVKIWKMIDKYAVKSIYPKLVLEIFQIKDAKLDFTRFKRNIEDPDTCEYFVSVKWTHNTKDYELYWEPGLRANQNSAFRLMNDFKIKKLTEHFKLGYAEK